MKTYPYTTDEGIIELVRKDEHDAVVVELLARLGLGCLAGGWGRGDESAEK